jgi:hypothetical protein
MRTYPEFDGVTTSRFDGYSWYHSFQLGAEKRFSKGYTLQANYTWSKYMQATEMLNVDDPGPLEVISDQDRPHRVTISGVWELPFGKGRAIGGDVNSFTNALIGGWQFNGIYMYQTGSVTGNWGNIIFRGNIEDIALPSSQRTVDKWFNVDAGFERLAANQLVSNKRVFPLRFTGLRNDSINNWDLSVIKNNRIKESMNLQFRFEFLNAFNHPLFPQPTSLDPTAAGFGKIQPSNQANYARRIQMGARFLF